MKIYTLTESELQELKKIRNYFGEHDKTSFEHGAFDFLDNLINSATEEVVTKEDDYVPTDKDFRNFLLWLGEQEDFKWDGEFWNENTGHDDFEQILMVDMYDYWKEKIHVPSDNNNEGAALASHSCTIGNSIQQFEKIPVMIKCPECETIQAAIIERTVPFSTYIHHCENCKYIIMESEWYEIKPFQVKSKAETIDSAINFYLRWHPQDLRMASVKHFTETGTISGSFYIALCDMLKMYFQLEHIRRKIQDNTALLNSDKNVQVSDTTEADSSNADHQIKISELREKFFDECVSQGHAGVLGHYERIALESHELFEWFKPYLKTPSIDWEGLEDKFLVVYSITSNGNDIFNWLKTKLQDYIK